MKSKQTAKKRVVKGWALVSGSQKEFKFNQYHRTAVFDSLLEAMQAKPEFDKTWHSSHEVVPCEITYTP